MINLIPDVYKKNIFDIDYNKLKKEGIVCLVFDLDNTLGLITDLNCPDNTKELIKKLKEDFMVIIMSNNNNKRIKPYLEELKVDGVSFSLKPSTRGLKKIYKKYSLTKDKMCIIGDQLVTDILTGKRFKIKNILVDPLAKKDLKITSINRIIENIIITRYQKKGLFKKGKYYG